MAGIFRINPLQSWQREAILQKAALTGKTERRP